MKSVLLPRRCFRGDKIFVRVFFLYVINVYRLRFFAWLCLQEHYTFPLVFGQVYWGHLGHFILATCAYTHIHYEKDEIAKHRFMGAYSE